MAKNQCTKERTLDNIRQYLSSFGLDITHAIHQFLEWFEIDTEIEDVIDAIIKANLESDRISAERFEARKRSLPYRGEFEQGGRRGRPPPEPNPMRPIRYCECGGMITGEPIVGCEMRESGRVFYEQCDTCPYWLELLEKGKKYTQRTNLTGG